MVRFQLLSGSLLPRWTRMAWVLCGVGLMVWEGPTPTQAQDTPTTAFLYERCEGYRGVEGTCLTASCPSLHHDLFSLPTPEFVARHGSPCGSDLAGNKLVCCPKEASQLASESCGSSTLRQHQRPGVAEPGAWPWLARLYYHDLAGWGSTGCLGALVSDTHVLTLTDCAPDPTFDWEINVILGEYRKYNHTGVQNITAKIAVRAMHWTGRHQELAVLVLETPAVLVPNVVWPVCLSVDPAADLGFSLDGLNPNEKQIGFFPYWPILDQEVGTIPLHQTLVFFSNCSVYCEGPEFQDSCSGYNATRGNRNPVCVGGINERECKKLSGEHGQPIVVESEVTGEFFLVGLTQTSICRDINFNFLLIPIMPIARDIKRIIQ